MNAWRLGKYIMPVLNKRKLYKHQCVQIFVSFFWISLITTISTINTFTYILKCLLPKNTVYKIRAPRDPILKTNNNIAFHADNPITVEPIRKEDLQVSYAHEMEVPDNGWYGGFVNGCGTICGGLGTIPCCFCFPRIHSSLSARVMLVLSHGLASFTSLLTLVLSRSTPCRKSCFKLTLESRYWIFLARSV